MKKAKKRYLYTWKRDGKWVTHFNSIKGIPQEVIATPFNSFTPFEAVRKSIELLNPQYKVVRCRRHEGNNISRLIDGRGDNVTQ